MLRRRYEIPLPLRHNDGRPVSDDKLNQTREELVNRFEGVSVQPQSILGIWLHEGRRYEDTSVRLTVDVDDTPENHQFFLEFKATLLTRFEQLEIYIASYPVDILKIFARSRDLGPHGAGRERKPIAVGLVGRWTHTP